MTLVQQINSLSISEVLQYLTILIVIFAFALVCFLPILGLSFERILAAISDYKNKAKDKKEFDIENNN